MNIEIDKFIDSQTGFMSVTNTRYHLEAKLRQSGGVTYALMIDRLMDRPAADRKAALEFLIAKLRG